MTSGGTTLGAPAPAAPPPERRWITDPRLVEHLPAVLAVVVFAGVFLRIRQRWFMPGYSGAGYTEWVVRSTVEGTAIAPNQYRPLMPWVMTLLAEIARIPLPTAILATDAALLVVVLILLHRLSMRFGASWLMLAAAAGWAWLAVKLDHWHPEIMLLTCIVLAVTLLLSGPCPPPLHLAALGLLACGARTDYAAGLGLVVLAVGVARRRRMLVGTGALVGVVAVAWTVVLAEVVYPRARYQVDVVQIPYNLTPGSLVSVLTFYGPLLVVPALLAARRRALPPLAVVLGWFVVEFAATFVIGRPDESRLFMPLVPACAIAAAVAWRELRRDVTAGRPV